jgi:hypothetical protein
MTHFVNGRHVAAARTLAGMAIEVAGTSVRFVGWEQTTDFGNGDMGERRIVARMAMSNDTARQLSALLRNMLTQGGH